MNPSDKRRRTNIERLCDALNEMGIKTSIPRSIATKDSLVAQAIRKTENARRQAVKEIGRISNNACKCRSKRGPDGGVKGYQS
jgi:hypothetical protein